VKGHCKTSPQSEKCRKKSRKKTKDAELGPLSKIEIDKAVKKKKGTQTKTRKRSGGIHWVSSKRLNGEKDAKEKNQRLGAGSSKEPWQETKQEKNGGAMP